MDDRHHEGTPEDLLDRVARQARDDELADRERDERLRRLAEGTLGDDELAALRAEAEASEEARADYEMFAPLGNEYQERVLQALRARTAADATEARVGRAAGDEQGWIGSLVRARSWLPLAAAILVAVTSVWLVVLLTRPAAPAFELASYEAELSGYLRSERGPDPADGELPSFGPESTFRIVFTPDFAPEQEPQLAFYFASERGELVRWRSFSQSDGAVRIETRVAELPLAPGVWTLYFVHGRPGALPDPSAAEDLVPHADDSWRTVPVTFRIVAADSASDELQLEVLYGGCFDVLPGPTCLRRPGIRLWARSVPGAEIALLVDGRPAAVEEVVEAQDVDGGRRFRLDLSDAAHSVEIVAEDGGRSRSFELAVRPSELPPWYLDASRAAWDGDHEGARAFVEEGLPRGPELARGYGLFLLSQLRGSEDERLELLEESTDVLAARGSQVQWAHAFGALLSFDIQAREFQRARQRLDRHQPGDGDRPGMARLMPLYYRGILEAGVGNFRDALRAQTAASELARRLGWTREQVKSDGERAEILHLLGRGREADDLLSAAQAAADTGFLVGDCDRAELLNVHAWIRILAEGSLGDASPLLDRADGLAAGGHCSDLLGVDLAVNRALLHTQRGEGFEARHVLDRFDRLREHANTLQVLWLHDLNGRLALYEGRPDDALGHYRDMEDLADLAFDPRATWRARLQQASASRMQGRSEQALVAYEAAEKTLDEQLFAVPLDGGRDRFAGTRDAGSRGHVDLLLELGRVDDALRIARRSRARHLRSLRLGHRLARLDAGRQATWDLEISRYLQLRDDLEQLARDDWRRSQRERDQARARLAELRGDALAALDRAFRVVEVPATDLPPMRPGELVLAVHPLPEGWVAFAARPDGVRASRFETDHDSERLAEALLEPFRPWIEEAESIRVLAYGELQRVDFHSLPWDGEPLLVSKPVSYGLDVDVGPRRESRASSQHLTALVVGDPLGDLPAAGREASLVAETLRDGAYEVTPLDGRQATVGRLRLRLPRSRLFHLAGHSTFDGESAWDGALLLADGGRLTVGDVLALERAPEEVVLSSCESARPGAGTQAGLGLAQAFLLAGSRRVIAAVRPVGDSDTAGLFRRVYGDPSRGLAEGLRLAQLAWRREDPAADWASFRVLEP